MADVRAAPAVRQYPIEALWITEHDLDPNKVIFSYDRPSDTLMVFFQGRERRSVVAGGTDYSFLLVDPATNEIVGLQIEDFLARAVSDNPRLCELLEYAELRGITLAEARRECQQIGSTGAQRFVATGSEQRTRRPVTPEAKQSLVQALLRDDRFGLPANLTRGAA